MPRVRSAKIALPSRVEISGEIANLSESSVFVKTNEPLRFGDRVKLTLFNIEVGASVAFVSGDQPKGAVLVFAPPPVLVDLIAVNSREVEALSPAAKAANDPWLNGISDNSDVLDTRTEPGNNVVIENVDTSPEGVLALDILPPEELVRIEPSRDILFTPPTHLPVPRATVPQATVPQAGAAEAAARALSRASSGARGGLPAPTFSQASAREAMPSLVPQPAPPPARAPSRAQAPVPVPVPAPAAAAGAEFMFSAGDLARSSKPLYPREPPPIVAPPKPAPPRAKMEELSAMLDSIQLELDPTGVDNRAKQPAPAPALAKDAMPIAPPVQAASVPSAKPQPARSASTPGLPATRSVSSSGLTPPRSISTPAPAAAPAAPLAPAKAEPDLPLLETDGVTLRFSSPDQYRAQHKANIAHGGIIVRALPLPIGTQKFIGIEVPGRDRYTISARVTFIGDGTVGFVIDSFPIHKAQLKSFAEA